MLLMIVVVASSQAALNTEQPLGSTVNPTVGNPAAIYCAEVMGYDYAIITDSDGGQKGICELPDNQ